MIATEKKVTRRYIITGGPGSGKSTLIETLEQHGHRCYPEASRELIRREAQRPNGVLPWNDLEAFARLAFDEMLRQHNHAATTGDSCFFDRALPDIFGYLQRSRFDIPKEYLTIHGGCRYERTVFILPPWPEIYINDDERPQSLDEAEALHDAIRTAYESLGYELIEVPKLPVNKRYEFVLETLQEENSLERTF